MATNISSRELQRLQTRQRIYECAMEIFRRDGVTAARTDDIAKAAGVSRGAFYFHFQTKEHVLLARMHETEEEICGDLAELGDETPLSTVLAVHGAALARIWEPDPELLPDLAGAALRFTATAMWDQESTPLRAELARRFALASARGELTARLPAPILSDLYLGNTLAGLLAWYGNRGIPLEGVLAAVTELFWSGVGLRPPTPNTT
ncbi:MAG: TetR/AcrR family transcriptional regulator [Myxococcales bacterium]|nr:TetR/AcrR family transcriptional regulator [Myxococcales bacterium]